MCGIVGMVAKTPSSFAWKDKQVMEQLLYVNALRGWDSTGLFSVNKHGNLKMIKAAKDAHDLMSTKTSKDFLQEVFMNAKVVVGHNRSATKGKTTDENAHPFIEKHICLVHNGTLNTHKHLKDVEVDSHAICHAFAEDDPKEVIPNLNGAYALVWYDALKKKLNITRNQERPLWIAQYPTVDFFASEPQMLSWILARNGYTYQKPEYFEVGHLYHYDIDTLTVGLHKEALPKKNLPAVTNYYSGYNKSTNTSEEDYKYGDKVMFSIENHKIINEKYLYTGILAEDHTQKATLFCDAEQGKELVDENYIMAIVSGYSKKEGITTLILNKPEKIKTYVSVNNFIVTEAEIEEHTGACDSCGHWVDPDKELFWVRYKGGKIKAMKCEECVTKDKYLRQFIND